MNIELEFTRRVFHDTVQLPASKSISNRVLIINALADNHIPVENLSDCDDTRNMLKVLQSDRACFDVGHAGTAMRFLTAFLSRIAGKWEITGSERMKQRPIAVLVDALNKLGARIEYLEKTGCPPLRIYGSHITGGELEISASVSSQYISALMMIAPFMDRGLVLKLTGKTVSRTYIEMTAGIMREFGAKVETGDSVIQVFPGDYRPVPYKVEADWSGASYFYEMLAVSNGGEICLPGLNGKSWQGDARQTGVWAQLGIETHFLGEQVVLRKKTPEVRRLVYDFVEMPDLVQSFAVACCLLEIPFYFSGVETLRIKETDRIAGLIQELSKLGYRLGTDENGCLLWDGTHGEKGEAVINTYDDHRMAMAFAPAALHFPGLTICDKEVVSKSFPAYWEQMEKLGGKIIEKSH